MEQASPIEARAQQQLLEAMRAGTLQLVDEHGQPMALLAALDHRCWAHLKDAEDGQVYVHEVSSSRELMEPRYLALLGINV